VDQAARPEFHGDIPSPGVLAVIAGSHWLHARPDGDLRHLTCQPLMDDWVHSVLQPTRAPSLRAARDRSI